MSANLIGRETVTIIELYQQKCINIYGSAPCVANKPAGQECYNTKRTCQDDANYDGSASIVWRFTKASTDIDDLFEIDGSETKTFAIPSLLTSSTSPTVINVAGANENSSALGKRASLTATFKDHTYNDQVADDYIITRSYNPENQGTFWGKFIARNPYYQNSKVVIYEGYKGDALSAMNKREYVVDSININDAGIVSLTARDPLRLTDDKRTQAPVATDLQLFEDLAQGSTVVKIKGTVAQLASIGTSSKQYLNINNEILSYSGYSDQTTHFLLSSVVRAEFSTEDQEHDANDKVQHILRYENTKPYLVVDDLLRNHTAINTGLWDINDWKDEYDKYLNGLLFTGTISKPKGVDKILASLCQQGNFYIWWNDRAAKIEFKTVRPSDAIPTLLSDEANIVSGATPVKTSPDSRFSRALVYYDQVNPLENIDETTNYKGLFIRVDADSEQPSEYGEARSKNIYANFLANDQFVTTLATTFVQRFRDNPKYMTIQVDAKDGSLWTGDIVDVSTRAQQNFDGSDATGRWQIVSAKEIISGETIEYMLQNFVFVGRFATWMADDALDYTSTPEDQRANGCWWSDDNGNMSNGDKPYKWQ